MTHDAKAEINTNLKPRDEAFPAHEDRRLYRRYLVAVPAQLEVGGKSYDCAITDLSLGGVAIEPSFPDAKGEVCHLHTEDFYFPSGMRGKVVNITDSASHISFDLDDDMEAALTMFLVMSPATR